MAEPALLVARAVIMAASTACALRPIPEVASAAAGVATMIQLTVTFLARVSFADSPVVAELPERVWV